MTIPMGFLPGHLPAASGGGIVGLILGLAAVGLGSLFMKRSRKPANAVLATTGHEQAAEDAAVAAFEREMAAHRDGSSRGRWH